MIAHGGRLLLTDFGVARLETEDSLVTKTGAVLGTPAYMSPEQASGDIATAKSDLYALGATLYQLATGSLPYGGAAARMLAQIASGGAAPAVRRRPAVGAPQSRNVEPPKAVGPSKRPIDAEGVAGELRALVAAGGLGEPRDELVVRYFGDPAAFVRDRTPAVVGALVAAAQKAIAEHRMPRAMALADRASALAPEDPAVAALVSTVTAGGSSVKTRVAIGGAVVAVLAAGGGAVAMLHGDTASVRDDAAVAMLATDARPVMVDATLLDASLTLTSPPDAIVAKATQHDAGTRVVAAADAHLVTIADAVVAAAPPDAADVAIVAPDAAPAGGAIHVVSDSWCNVAIDGVDRGRLANTPYRVDAGHHTVACAQNATRHWELAVEVAPGQTAEARGALLPDFDVTVAAAVTIDGHAVAPGTTLKLRFGSHELQAGTYRQFLDVRQRCTLRQTTDEAGNIRFDCFP